jgi:hypothetical protein
MGTSGLLAFEQMLMCIYRPPEAMLSYEFDEVTQSQLPTAIIFRHYGHDTDKAVILFKTLLSGLSCAAQNAIPASLRKYCASVLNQQYFLRKAHILLILRNTWAFLSYDFNEKQPFVTKSLHLREAGNHNAVVLLRELVIQPLSIREVCRR